MWDAACIRVAHVQQGQLMPAPQLAHAHDPQTAPQGAVKGEGGLDDATGTNKFGGGASMKQTSAAVDLTQIKEKDDEEKVRGWASPLPRVLL